MRFTARSPSRFTHGFTRVTQQAQPLHSARRDAKFAIDRDAKPVMTSGVGGRGLRPAPARRGAPRPGARSLPAPAASPAA